VPFSDAPSQTLADAKEETDLAVEAFEPSRRQKTTADQVGVLTTEICTA
jgi:hypothetical protein